MFSPALLQQFENKETPFYYYDMGLLNQTLDQVKQYAQQYDFHVHYALKANFNEPILKAIRNKGFGADCVSGNEVLKAIEVGFAPSHVVFAGVGKTDKEILTALKYDIFCFNCESIPEIEVINQLAAQTHKKAHIAVRINPNVEANTHKYITTGLSENKFGINLDKLEDVLATIRQCENINLVGIHFHIGSQIRDLENFKQLCQRINEIQAWFENQQIKLTEINVGGGLGINYQDPDGEPIADFKNYFGLFAQHLQRRPHQRIHFELGRAIVAQCGSLISRVIYVKNGVSKNFAILDAGMTELIRPALYQAYHKIENLSATTTQETLKYDVVGPVCESSDFFGKDIELPLTQRNDLIAIRSAGAYGEVMTSFYNLREKAGVIYQ